MKYEPGGGAEVEARVRILGGIETRLEYHGTAKLRYRKTRWCLPAMFLLWPLR